MLAKWHRYRALLPSCNSRCWRVELGMRCADLRRRATAVIAKPASALLYDTSVWYLVWVCGCVGVCLVVGRRAMRWVKKTRVKRFRLSFSTGRSSRKSSASRKISRKKLSQISSFAFSTVYDVRKPDLGFSCTKKRFLLTNPSV